MIDSIPLPTVDDPADQAFWQACLEDRLLVQECGRCGHVQHPPRAMCPRCRSMELGWRDCPQTGRLWSFVIPRPPLLPAFAELSPYAVGLVVPDGLPHIRMVGAIVVSAGEGIGSLAPESLAIGDPMQAAFVHLTADVALPCWAPSNVHTSPEREETP